MLFGSLLLHDSDESLLLHDCNESLLLQDSYEPLFLQDSNDFSNIQLTPEQQRQLELIEKMPLLKETHPGETAPFVTPELGDPDIGMSITVFNKCTLGSI